MAPMGRKRAVELVKTRRLPVWLGAPHPSVMILEQDTKFRIRQLVIDAAEAERASAEALAQGEPWMPEQYYDLGKPAGEIYAEADTVEGLIVLMKNMRWPDEW